MKQTKNHWYRVVDKVLRFRQWRTTKIKSKSAKLDARSDLLLKQQIQMAWNISINNEKVFCLRQQMQRPLIFAKQECLMHFNLLCKSSGTWIKSQLRYKLIFKSIATELLDIASWRHPKPRETSPRQSGNQIVELADQILRLKKPIHWRAGKLQKAANQSRDADAWKKT